ncbi:MAG: putative tRNA-dihydrouridine synthase 1 [Streblomastix strix]|uniref:tRNA-dihydrouridine(16/17) synthase [NAD(P)(+)] n=1 Tax=Streblomastix strix TaxID=222440 RepID=A0A5J4US06_9EUKA|nr:MAG: putative tRNA-dihydrouridine synthase 1 [Streblomastix strix]
MLEAAKYVENYCDAIDINFGCPQNIAKSGHYGAYLQDNLSLMSQLVSTLHHNLHIPVTAKFRKQTDIQQTIRIAEMLEQSGAQVICIHGRTREQKGMDLGHSDWECIRIVREHVHVPFISNGSILCKEDVVNCLNYTKADAVMCGDECLRMRLQSFELYSDLRNRLGEAKSYDELEQIVDQLEERLRSGAEPQPHYQRHKTDYIDQGDLMDGVNLFDEQIQFQ